MSDKRFRYSQLVNRRKECRLCEGLTNPNDCHNGLFDDGEYIGPWTRWQGNLDAALMLIGQDWGGTDHYLRYRGTGNDANPTNETIRELLASISIFVHLPSQSGPNSLFFTNAILCLRSVGLSGPTQQTWFRNCSATFLRPQIDLVRPKVVATLGLRAYWSVMKAYEFSPKVRMRDAVKEIKCLPNGSLLVPLYHPGKLGIVSRSLPQQRVDWTRVRQALDHPQQVAASSETS